MVFFFFHFSGDFCLSSNFWKGPIPWERSRRNLVSERHWIHLIHLFSVIIKARYVIRNCPRKLLHFNIQGKREVTRTISSFPLLDNSYTLNPTVYGHFFGAHGWVVLLGGFGAVFFGEGCVLLLWGFFNELSTVGQSSKPYRIQLWDLGYVKPERI